MTDEQWRDIGGFPKYEVSDQGAVRNIRTGRILKAWVHGRTPPKIMLTSGEYFDQDVSKRVTVYVHRLVAAHFVPGYDDERVVEFIDGNAKNCKASNLTVGKRKARGLSDSD